ncbi:hypothetical protein [Agreia sp. COWG]|uniref:hypothetical protein n=1 Tax=Agreia sp. COWG TaxID=2773266 RepID=UPI001AF41E54|nr:hypothetical protein [Agreia sp. COWG]CAD6007780.1 DNA-directed RNA polymerase III 47 kDa polypeptide [Agreia sp. COWG]
MANAGSKCPVCLRTVAVGIVSQTLVQHEDKTGFRCAGSGTSPGAGRPAAAPRKTAATSTPRTSTSSAAKRTSPATKGGVTVRRIEVDPEILARRQEKQERIREERAAAARDRNDANISYFDELR